MKQKSWLERMRNWVNKHPFIFMITSGIIILTFLLWILPAISIYFQYQFLQEQPQTPVCLEYGCPEGHTETHLMESVNDTCLVLDTYGNLDKWRLRPSICKRWSNDEPICLENETIQFYVISCNSELPCILDTDLSGRDWDFFAKSASYDDPIWAAIDIKLMNKTICKRWDNETQEPTVPPTSLNDCYEECLKLCIGPMSCLYCEDVCEVKTWNKN